MKYFMSFLLIVVAVFINQSCGSKSSNENFDKDRLVIQVIGDTVKARKKLETATGSKDFSVDGKIGYNDTLGISLRPEYSVYSTKMAKIQFVLYNNSGDIITCGNRYSITYRDEKGVWREFPINGVFADVEYVVQNEGSRFIDVSLDPDAHLNDPGRYRFFYEIGFEGDRMTFMTEFRLTDNKKELEQVAKSVPFYMSPKLTNSNDGIDKNGNRDSTFTPVDIMPEFPGGNSQLNKFIEDNMQYPFVSRQNGVQGRVFVMVVIEKDGSIAKCRILRSVDPDLDQEALRIVNKMPRWKPGKRDGKSVRAQYTFPVLFKLVDN